MNVIQLLGSFKMEEIKKYVCLGHVLNTNNKLSKRFVELGEGNNLIEDSCLLFTEGKGDYYWFGHIYNINKNDKGYRITNTKEKYSNQEVLDKYTLQQNENQNVYWDIKQKKKKELEQKKWEKENVTIERFTLRELKEMVQSKKISVYLFRNLLEKFQEQVVDEMFRK